MSIDFTQIPDELLVPGQYQEIDNSLAGSTGEEKKALVIGIKGSAGTAEANTVIAVSGDSKARSLLEEGYPAAVMAMNFMDLNKVEKLYVLPLDEAEAGVAAVKSYTFTASPTEDGTFVRYVNGKKVSMAVSSGGELADLASAFVAAVNSVRDMEVEASVNTEETTQVLLTALAKGENGNQMTVEAGLYGESDPAGIAATLADVTTGSGNPSVENALAAMGETKYHYIITDLSDSANIALFAAELKSRYSGTRQCDGRMFLALCGEDGDESTEDSLIEQASGINSPHIVLVPRGENPQTPAVWAARFAAPLVRTLSDDPAANTYDTEIDGLISTTERDADTRENLLEAGIATYRVDSAGTVLVERVVTSYNEDSDGNRNTSYLDVQVTETISRIRSEINAEARTRYKTWKLASTEENFGSGSKVMTPDTWKAFLVGMYSQEFIKEKQWCQDLESYKDSILVEISSDEKTRLNYSHKPTLIGQFYIGAGLTQFD